MISKHSDATIYNESINIIELKYFIINYNGQTNKIIYGS